VTDRELEKSYAEMKVFLMLNQSFLKVLSDPINWKNRLTKLYGFA